MIGLHVRQVISMSVLVETVFNMPGLGRLLVRSVFDKDFLTVQICIMIIGLIAILSNLLVDISYGWLDPRIRYD